MRRIERPICKRPGCKNKVKDLGRQFCSHTCRAVVSKTEKSVCQREGCDRETKRANAKYCGKECADEAGRVRRYCVIPGCNNVIKHRNREGKYCSIKCRGEGTAKMFKEKRAECGREGCTNKVKNPRNKYCSYECSGNAVRTDPLPICMNEGCRRRVTLRRNSCCSYECASELHGRNRRIKSFMLIRQAILAQ